MTPAQYDRLLDRLPEIRSTDELFDLELRLGPFDEEDAIAGRALFQLACARCQLSRGPALSPDSFVLTRPAPARVRESFEVRGRLDSRIVRIGWADGAFYGSLYALRVLEPGAGDVSDAAAARRRIAEVLDVVLHEERERAVA